MITTNDENIWRKVWASKDNGKNYDAVHEREHSIGFKWIHDSFGSNWRMTEIQAVIGRIQLKRMTQWHERRIENANKIWKAAKKCQKIRVPDIPDYIDHAAYKCYVFVNGDLDFRNRVISYINKSGVPCYTGSCSEVYLEKAFHNTSFRPNQNLVNAKILGDTSLMFLVHPTLTDKEIKKTCNIFDDLSVMDLGS